MIRTIIKDIESTELKQNPKLLLKLNSRLKKMGFKEVYVRNPIYREEDYLKELTLFFKPRMSDYDYYSTNEEMRTHLKEKTGTYINEINYLRVADENSIKIKLKNHVIGVYMPDRNLILFYIGIIGYEEKWVYYMLKLLENWVNENKPKQIDNTEIQKKLLYEQFSRETKNQIKSLVSKINKSREDITNYQNHIIEGYSTLNQNKKQIETLKLMLNKINESIEEYLKEIRKLKFVKRVGLSSRGIRVDFEKISIKVDGKNIEMGEYFVYLKPNKIEIKNKTPVTFNGSIYHGCHITDTTICFGNGEEKIYELLGNMKLKEAVYFLYLYLKSYNPDDTHISMENWIKAKENGGTYDEDDEDENDEGEDRH